MLKRFSFPKGKKVQILAHGSRYEGIIKAASDSELYLQGSQRTWVIPIQSISKCTEVPTQEAAVDIAAFVQKTQS